MSSVLVNEVRKGFYLDSVALMRLSRELSSGEGVEDAALMMGTPANRRILADAGLLVGEGESAGGGDLIIAVRAADSGQAAVALAQARVRLAQPRQTGVAQSAWQPRTLRAALKQAPKSSLALISVPGAFAVAEARKAIRRGLDVMIFSDNVPLQEEVALKQEAQQLGRLVMGPDCGTAIINGVPLAFANEVSAGDIGIVGASGTGLQEVCCLIDRYGGGISHAIGVGGRDLHSEVGAVSTLMAVEALATDVGTSHLVLISKPPPAVVADKVLACVAECSKPATICFIGAGPMPMPENCTQVFTLKAAAEAALGKAIEPEVSSGSRLAPPGRTAVRGLFAGGTLCQEAQAVFLQASQSVGSNAPIPGASDPASATHQLLDLGDDEYTRGRPHPMIDPAVRDGALIEAMSDPAVAVVLLDLVIGYGAHSDPAASIVNVLNGCSQSDSPLLITSVTGTDNDPQQRAAQIARVMSAGVLVAPTNADAAEWALAAIQS